MCYAVFKRLTIRNFYVMLGKKQDIQVSDMARTTGTDQGNKFSEKPRLERLLLLMTGSAGGEYDAERGQAIIRIAITCLLLIYLVIMLAVAKDQDSQQFSRLTSSFFVYFLIYFCLALLLIYWIVRKPGNYTYRRIFTMTMDYGSLTLWMLLGGMVTLPFWAIVLWVTVGNGLRFGHRYLVVATCYALASLLIVWFFEDYWGANPYVVVTMALTTILVPAYIYGLLTRLQIAHEATIEANQAKSRFLAHASHDLRQPIHAISLYVACLRDEKLSRESRSMVENIDRSLQSVSRLFKSLLDISTLDSGDVKPDFKTIAVRDILADVISQNKSAIEWSHTSVRIIPCSAHVKADGVLLASMVQNLISNAVKYAPGTDILIGCRRRHGRLSIEVHDRGPGIPKEHLPHLFEELYRVRNTGDRDIDGVGLGLPIVRRLGKLWGCRSKSVLLSDAARSRVSMI